MFTNDSEDADVKLVDFGFARLIQDQPLTTPCFTLTYAAPEVRSLNWFLNHNVALYPTGLYPTEYPAGPIKTYKRQ